MKNFVLAALLLFPALSFAADTHRGIDDDGNGTYDLLFAGDDADNDGFPTGSDCDDNNPRMYDGQVTVGGCAGTQYKLCSAGTLSACTAGPYCPATGTGVCKYIDCGSGSDTTGNGSYATPWKTFGMVSGGMLAGFSGAPSGAYSLLPGDAVVLIGSGTCSTAFNDGSVSVLGHFSKNGSNSGTGEIHITRLPGSTAQIIPASGEVFYIDGDFYHIWNLDMKVTSGSDPLIRDEGGDDLNVENVYVYDTSGNGDNNFAPLRAVQTNRVKFNRNLFKNIKRSSGNGANVSCMTFIDDSGNSTGQNEEVKYNRAWWDTYDGTNNGALAFWKHGVSAAEAGTNGAVVLGNIAYNAATGIRMYSSKLRASNNLFVTDTGSTSGQCLQIYDNGLANPQEDEDFTYNTCVNTSSVLWGYPAFNGSEQLRINHNVFVENRTSYSDINAFLSLLPRSTNTEKALADAYPYITASANSYYNSTALTGRYCYFCDNSTASIDQGFGGALAAWQALGYDSGSVEANPVLDTSYRTTAVAVTDRGWRLSTGATTTTTTTTTITTTTTTTTTSTTTTIAGGTGNGHFGKR